MLSVIGERILEFTAFISIKIVSLDDLVMPFSGRSVGCSVVRLLG